MIKNSVRDKGRLHRHAGGDRGMQNFERLDETADLLIDRDIKCLVERSAYIHVVSSCSSPGVNFQVLRKRTLTRESGTAVFLNEQRAFYRLFQDQIGVTLEDGCQISHALDCIDEAVDVVHDRQ